MSLIWATRGRNWGFRFLRDGGYNNPLRVYEEVFADIGGDPEVWRRDADKGALRFPDPLGRKDRSGRIIPHDFVVFGAEANEIDSVADGCRLVWPQVADEFKTVWELPTPPSASS